MSRLRLYRAAFAPLLVSIAILAFSLGGVPVPLEPPPGTISFDPDNAARTARALEDAGGVRPPGSAADSAAADIVAARFAEIVAGTTQEQQIEASGPDGDVSLRNVIITLPGQSDLTTVVVAGRDGLPGSSAGSAAAATGALVELANVLAVVERRRTVVLASTSGASLSAEGARSLVGALPERLELDAGLAITRPGAAVISDPHLLGLAPGTPPLTLVETGVAVLEARAMVDAGTPGLAEQLARLALPAATGEEAALAAAGVAAIGVSSAGEIEMAGDDALDRETLARFGPALVGIVQAIDEAPGPIGAPGGKYLRAGDNLIRSWTLALVSLCLLLPALALAAFARASAGKGGGRAWSWAAEWWIAPIVVLVSVWLLGVAGVIPAAGAPYDPRRIELGVPEAGVLLLLLALGGAVWWLLGLRRVPAGPAADALAASTALLTLGACLFAWLLNPYLAFLLAPLAHVGALGAIRSNRARRWMLPAFALALVPAVVATAIVASALDWGFSAPWQLVALASGGGIPRLEVLAGALAVSGAAASAWVAVVGGARGQQARSPAAGRGQPPAQA